MSNGGKKESHKEKPSKEWPKSMLQMLEYYRRRLIPSSRGGRNQ